MASIVFMERKEKRTKKKDFNAQINFLNLTTKQ
jgi:hypothetical protein